jgi:hypothetical protein
MINIVQATYDVNIFVSSYSFCPKDLKQHEKSTILVVSV